MTTIYSWRKFRKSRWRAHGAPDDSLRNPDGEILLDEEDIEGSERGSPDFHEPEGSDEDWSDSGKPT